ncbi:hypothetical protein, partial [Salmonella enterica]|uniref:hypothetical protein n=1 Tax=Salmonella enterica TaxID=28901 RepID=UPI0020C4D57A
SFLSFLLKFLTLLLDAQDMNFFSRLLVGMDNVRVSHLKFADDTCIIGGYMVFLERQKPLISRILTSFHLSSDLEY